MTFLAPIECCLLVIRYVIVLGVSASQSAHGRPRSSSTSFRFLFSLLRNERFQCILQLRTVMNCNDQKEADEAYLLHWLSRFIYILCTCTCLRETFFSGHREGHCHSGKADKWPLVYRQLVGLATQLWQWPSLP